jgi:methylmalonyl-CoA epimerase
LLEGNKIDHLGVAVRDVDAAAQIYETLGLSVTETVDVPEQEVKVAFIPVGESSIEWVQPTSEEGLAAKHLAKRGEGLHHLAVQVDDIDLGLSELRAAGTQLIDEVPRRGADRVG